MQTPSFFFFCTGLYAHIPVNWEEVMIISNRNLQISKVPYSPVFVISVQPARVLLLALAVKSNVCLSFIFDVICRGKQIKIKNTIVFRCLFLIFCFTVKRESIVVISIVIKVIKIFYSLSHTRARAHTHISFYRFTKCAWSAGEGRLFLC